jgi:hypothetical protein
MVNYLLFYALPLIALLWLGVILYEQWACTRAPTRPTTRKLATPLPKHSQNPTPFPGLTHKPSCDACEQGPALAEPVPLPPLPLPSALGAQILVERNLYSLSLGHPVHSTKSTGVLLIVRAFLTIHPGRRPEQDQAVQSAAPTRPERHSSGSQT